MTKIIQRHDTAANWTTINPILASGEMGVETDTNKFKFGNGTSTWSELSYASSGSGGSGTTLTSADGATTYSKLALGNNFVVIPPETPWTNPQMTSNSQDGYVASASVSASTSNGPYRAFDKDITGQDLCWYTGSVSMPQWIMLECPEPVRLTSCMIMNEVKTPESFKSGYIQGSNDGSTFDTLYTITDRAATAGLQTTYQIDTNNYYKYLRVYCTATSGNGLSVQEIEFSGFVKGASATPTLNAKFDSYTKPETDNLLNSKQDKLTAVEPIAIRYEGSYEINGLTQVDGTLNSELEFTGASGAYLRMDEYYDLGNAVSWEFQIKYKHNGGGSSPIIFGYAGVSDCKTPRFITERNKLRLFLSSNGSSWNINQNFSSITLIVGTIYYFKVGFTGSQYYIKYNTTGWTNEFTNIFALSSTTNVYCSDYFMFMNATINNICYNTGTIYLQDTALIINGSEVWRGVKPSTDGTGTYYLTASPATTSSLGVVQPDGTSITVSETGVISGQDVKTFSGYSDTGTLVLKSINGVLQWVAES